MGNLKSGYWKFYYENGAISYQGHYRKGQKEDYWYFYHPDGTPIKEGHFKSGLAVNWWIYYDSKGHIIHKCQLEKGVKNGYCLKYVNQKLTSAEKFSKGQKINEWHTFGSFKRDNKLSDLK